MEIYCNYKYQTNITTTANIGKYVLVYMVQPLEENVPAYCLMCAATDKLRPIMLKNLPIMLLSIAQKIAHYAQNYANKIQLCSCSIVLISVQYKFNTLDTILQ